MYDVLCYGALCADHRIWLPHYPQPGQGIRVSREDLAAGGNALNEARALALWGNKVVLMGDHLGNDPGGNVIWDAVQALPVERAHLVRDPVAQTPRCHILITPDAQRTILAVRDDAAPCTFPSATLLNNCRLVSLTRYGPQTDRVAQMARQAERLLIVGDATRPDDAWARYADVIISSAELLHQSGASTDITLRMTELHAIRSATVIVTDGPRPVHAIWRTNGELHTVSVTPPPVETVNTTGAGDMFRAAVAHGLLRDWPWKQILNFACTKAAAYVKREM
jgi:sugar/nucleoside kinase (ribokinase family)